MLNFKFDIPSKYLNFGPNRARGSLHLGAPFLLIWTKTFYQFFNNIVKRINRMSASI